MIYPILILVGLCFGSFINALVWRIYQQDNVGKNKRLADKKLSIMSGRSMCVHCHHPLTTLDLIPIISWLSLLGKCRYCHKPISWQYPLVEASTAAIYTFSYYYWPRHIIGAEWLVFGVWMLILVCLIALFIYDLRWFLLPDRLVRPLAGLVIVQAIVSIVINNTSLQTDLLNIILATAIGGGLFYTLFIVSKGKWIGGGDVKLGFVLGLMVLNPANAVLVIFGASVLGSLYSLPLLLARRLNKNSHIPFGPFLIISAILVFLFGFNFISWYTRQLFYP